MGDGTIENPYTRKDVLWRIKKNGGTARGLNLAGKEFEEGIDLRKLDLKGIILKGAVFKRTHREVLARKGVKLEIYESEQESINIGALLSFAQLEGANLEHAHLEEASLTSANLEGTNLAFARLEESALNHANLKGASLVGAELYKAGLSGANLEGADLVTANLKGAELSHAHLDGADLSGAQLERTFFSGTEFPRNTKMEDVEWGNYVLGEETEGDKAKAKEWQMVWLGIAEETYRRLKIWHTEHGLYDTAGKFYYREKEAERKAQSWKKPHLKLWSWILRILCGYGEKPERVIISAAAIVFGLATAYFLWGSFSSSSFTDTLYYSVTSFTALGYGQWAPQPTGWAKGVGAAEAVLGVSMLALFLVTFTRKMIR